MTSEFDSNDSFDELTTEYQTYPNNNHCATMLLTLCSSIFMI